MGNRGRLFTAILPVVFSLPLLSQPSAPTFDVISVKAAPDAKNWVHPQPDDPQRFRALTIPHELIAFAWHIKPFQILEVPDWILREKFSVQATTGSPSTQAQMRLMVQALLIDRFGLKLHRETREIPTYALVIAKNGPNLTPTKAEEGTASNTQIGSGIFMARAAGMDDLTGILTDNLDRPVIDKTGLTGRYDFTLTFEPPVPPPGSTWAPIGAAIFAPLRELGLRLEPQKESVEMLVIDSIAHPSGD